MKLKDIINELNDELNKNDDTNIVDVQFVDDTDARMLFEDGYVLLTADAIIQVQGKHVKYPSKEAFDLIKDSIGASVEGFEKSGDKDILIKISNGSIITVNTSKPTKHEWIMVSGGGNSFAVA